MTSIRSGCLLWAIRRWSIDPQAYFPLLRLAVLLLDFTTENHYSYAVVHTQTRSSTSLIQWKDERRKTTQT